MDREHPASPHPREEDPTGPKGSRAPTITPPPSPSFKRNLVHTHSWLGSFVGALVGAGWVCVCIPVCVGGWVGVRLVGVRTGVCACVEGEWVGKKVGAPMVVVLGFKNIKNQAVKLRPQNWGEGRPRRTVGGGRSRPETKHQAERKRRAHETWSPGLGKRAVGLRTPMTKGACT